MTMTLRTNGQGPETTIDIAANGDSLTVVTCPPTYEEVLQAHVEPSNLAGRYKEAIARTTGWRGVVDQDDQEVAFSHDRFCQLLASRPELFRAFHGAVEDKLYGVVETKKKQPTESDPSAEAEPPTTE